MHNEKLELQWGAIFNFLTEKIWKFKNIMLERCRETGTRIDAHSETKTFVHI
jgi:hypothetical protein